MEFRTLRRDELEAWYDHTGEVFADIGRAYFARHMRNDPWPVLESVFVAMDGATIASTVRVFHRHMYLHGMALRMGGIGEVSTKDAYRKQGLSGKLLERAIAYMEANAFDASLLFTGTNAHYVKYGWRDVTRTSATEAFVPGRGDIEIRTATAADLPAMRALYDLYAPQFDGAIVRDAEAYWRRWVLGEAGDRTLTAWKEGRMIGYVTVGVGEDAIAVTDFARLPGEDMVLATLCAAAQKRYERGATRYPLPLNPTTKADTKDDNSMMARLIRPIDVDGPIADTEALVKAFRRTVSFAVDGF